MRASSLATTARPTAAAASRRSRRASLVCRADSVLIANTKGGGHAFLGLHLAKKLMGEGHKVTILNDGDEVRRERFFFSFLLARDRACVKIRDLFAEGIGIRERERERRRKRSARERESQEFAHSFVFFRLLRGSAFSSTSTSFFFFLLSFSSLP